MGLNQNQTVSILYDLAMALAGETRPRPLATTMLQHLLVHTGCACGAVLIRTQPASGEIAASMTAEVYATIGNRFLRSMEGKNAEWPPNLLQSVHVESAQDWFPGGEKYTHALNMVLPELGHVLLFSVQAPSESVQRVVTLFPPILAKFARSLRLCLDAEAHEKALAVARDAAEEGSRAKSLFMASMSHEFRTPLNAILGYAQLMEMDTGLPDSVLKNAHEIRLAGNHLLDLVSDILDLARIESGGWNWSLSALI